MKYPTNLFLMCLNSRHLTVPMLGGMAIVLCLFSKSSQAEIRRWNRWSDVIPGTEDITIGPGVDLSGWNTESRNLRHATGFSGEAAGSSFENPIGIDLTGANFSNSWIDGVVFTERLHWCSCSSIIPTPPNPKDTVFAPSKLTGVDFTGAVVTGTDFGGTTKSGFTAEQLYSTKSYQEKNLQGVSLDSNELTGWDFRDHNLTGVNFRSSTLTDVDLTGAVVTGADFARMEAPHALTAAQLYSTQSYRDKDLRGIWFSDGCASCESPRNSLTGWDFRDQNLTEAVFSPTSLQGTNFSGANLTSANLRHSRLTDTNLTGAIVNKTDLGETTKTGFTSDQLYSTKSYQERNLKGVNLENNDMSGWNFRGQDLSNAYVRRANLQDADMAEAMVNGANLDWAKLKNANLAGANLTNTSLQYAALKNADLTGAKIPGANFSGTTGLTFGSPTGFTPEQLYSTKSYQEQNLQGINLASNELTGWNFRDQDLTNANFWNSKLTDVDLTGVIVAGVNFIETAGFTAEQLYSTKSYQEKQLQGLQLPKDLTGWGFRDQDLTNANLSNSTLKDVDLTGAIIAEADLGATGLTSDQLYSTKSYQDKNLRGINLYSIDLTGWDFRGQGLSFANLKNATVTNADITGANITGIDLGSTTGLTSEQLYSTKNYQEQNLQGVNLSFNSLAGWTFRDQNLDGSVISHGVLIGADFAGANLTNASLRGSTLRDVDFAGADLRNANLSEAKFLETSSVIGTKYNQWTRFPSKFDPIAAGMTLLTSPLGDFDADDALDARDFDWLDGIVSRGHIPGRGALALRMFDMDGDGYVTKRDRAVWLTDVMHAIPGDANLDAEFNSGDFVKVFQSGKYETDEVANWMEGDWNLDERFDSSDFIVAFENGGYEMGSPAAVAAVPEPSGWMLLALGLLGVGRLRSR